MAFKIDHDGNRVQLTQPVKSSQNTIEVKKEEYHNSNDKKNYDKKKQKQLRMLFIYLAIGIISFVFFITIFLLFKKPNKKPAFGLNIN